MKTLLTVSLTFFCIKGFAQNGPIDSNHNALLQKLIDAHEVCDGLIYRFDKLDEASSREFLDQVMKLNFSNLKCQIDSTNYLLVDELYYEKVFVDFPRRFEDYLQQYLIYVIINNLEKAKKEKKIDATILAMYSAHISLNLIEASLIIQPRNKFLRNLREQAYLIINNRDATQGVSL